MNQFSGRHRNLEKESILSQSGEKILSSQITLRERLRTHKGFTKDQCFYLNYNNFSIKSYVLGVY